MNKEYQEGNDEISAQKALRRDDVQKVVLDMQGGRAFTSHHL
ncbi:hypothetical protein AAKU64_002573 [Undibacterium sp. GrIS 1.8]